MRQQNQAWKLNIPSQVWFAFVGNLHCFGRFRISCLSKPWAVLAAKQRHSGMRRSSPTAMQQSPFGETAFGPFRESEQGTNSTSAESHSTATLVASAHINAAPTCTSRRISTRWSRFTQEGLRLSVKRPSFMKSYKKHSPSRWKNSSTELVTKSEGDIYKLVLIVPVSLEPLRETAKYFQWKFQKVSGFIVRPSYTVVFGMVSKSIRELGLLEKQHILGMADQD